MCTIDSTTDGTTITIENYTRYQGVRTTSDTTGVATDVTTDGPLTVPQTDPYNNDKKGKKGENDNYLEREYKREKVQLLSRARRTISGALGPDHDNFIRAMKGDSV